MFQINAVQQKFNISHTWDIYKHFLLCWVFIAVHSLSLAAVHELLIVGFLSLLSTGSAVVEHRLSCPVACGIFPDQASNPHALNWQADSLPLDHQRSSYTWDFKLSNSCVKKGK